MSSEQEPFLTELFERAIDEEGVLGDVLLSDAGQGEGEEKRAMSHTKQVEHDPANQQTGQGATTTQPDSGEAVQAVLCPKATYATPEEAAAYVQQNGFDASDMEDAGEQWAFIQFEPGECSPQTARREALDDGCEVVYCTKGAGDTEQQPPAGPPVENRTMKHQNGQTCPACQGKGLSEAAGAQGGLTTPAQQVQDGKPEEKVPVSVKMFHAVKDALDEHGPMLEPDGKAKSYHAKAYTHLRKEATALHPDHDFGFTKEEEPKDDEETDTDTDDEGKDGKDKPDKDGDDEDTRKALEALSGAFGQLSERIEEGAQSLFRATGAKI